MHAMHLNLRRLDLNLLLVFDSLYRHRSVTAAAEELAMSPSACSHALARLRQALCDELFVRQGSAMQPTAQAEQLSAAVDQALQLLSSGVDAAGTFTPSTSQKTFTFTATDATSLAVLPGLIARLEQLAPRVRLEVHSASHRDSLDDLASGRTQFVLGFADEYSGSYEGIEALEGFSDDYVVVASSTHVQAGAGLTLEQYLSARHIAVIPWRDAGSVIDAALARQNLTRDVAVQVPGLAVAPSLVHGSRLLLTLPRRVAGQLCQDTGFAVFETPFLSPRYTLKVLFHARNAGTPAHRWVCEQLRFVLANADVAASSSASAC